VISTATKSLQEQLFQKDIPFLQRHFAPNLKAALMKGRSNFLCREKVQQMAGQPVLKGIDEVDWFSQIKDWEKLTETGDRSELTFLPDDAELAVLFAGGIGITPIYAMVKKLVTTKRPWQLHYSCRTRADAAPVPPFTAMKALVIAIEILAGSKLTTAPLRRITLCWA